MYSRQDSGYSHHAPALSHNEPALPPLDHAPPYPEEYDPAYDQVRVNVIFVYSILDSIIIVINIYLTVNVTNIHFTTNVIIIIKFIALILFNYLTDPV